MIPVLADVSADALQAATDAIAAHNVGVAIVAGVVIVVPLVLKAFKVPVPFLDPVLEMVLKAAALVFKGKKVVLPEPAPEEVAKQPGIAEVVPIKKDGA